MQSHYNFRKILLVILLLPTVFNFSCEKFVQVDPPNTQISSKSVFADDATADAAITGIYSRMISSTGFASGANFSVTALTGLSSDEFDNYSTNTTRIEFYNNALSSVNSAIQSSIWKEVYQYIYTANSMLEGLSASSNVSADTKVHLEGEAKFVRAFCNFYLVNLFGEIPLILSTDYKSNALSPRSDRANIYDQIERDLKDAAYSLPADYSASAGERVRPNKWVAMAMLAKIYLYAGSWSKAETYSDSLINNKIDFQILEDLNLVFLANSSECIWQLKPVNPNFNTNEGNLFILTSSPRQYALTSGVWDAFENGDKRKANWVGVFLNGTDSFYYPFKYKIKSGGDLTEYSMVFRLAEQYLIRSEARAMQNNITGSQNDLNIIRNRAGLSNTSAGNQADLLIAIEKERRTELFSEWGNRWLDLKRTNRADPLLSISKSPGWMSADSLYPIPQSERLLDPNLTQNPGY